MIRALRLAAVVSTLALATPLAAQSAEVTFEAVESVRIQAYSDTSSYVTVTGVVQGQATATTEKFRSTAFASCERMLTLSMERPGRYLVTVPSNEWDNSGCMLTRRK